MLGTGCIVLDGSCIEDNCIIGAGGVIKGKTGSNGIYVGNPAKLLKYRNLEEKYKLNYNPFFGKDLLYF